MYFYKLSTDDIYLYSDEGGGRHHRTTGAIQVPLMHEQQFSYEEFKQHIKEAYKGAMKFAPDRLRRLASGKTLDVPFERIVEGICEKYGYQEVPFVHTHNFEKEIKYDYYEEELTEVAMKNILIEEKPKKKSKSTNAFTFDDEIDDLFDELFDGGEDTIAPPLASTSASLLARPYKKALKAEDFDDFFEIEEGNTIAYSPGTVPKKDPVCATIAQGTVAKETLKQETEPKEDFFEWFDL